VIFNIFFRKIYFCASKVCLAITFAAINQVLYCVILSQTNFSLTTLNHFLIKLPSASTLFWVNHQFVFLNHNTLFGFFKASLFNLDIIFSTSSIVTKFDSEFLSSFTVFSALTTNLFFLINLLLLS